MNIVFVSEVFTLLQNCTCSTHKKLAICRVAERFKSLLCLIMQRSILVQISHRLVVFYVFNVF